ncbi:MAG: isochorismate synthase, partial [Glaciihabitans sp.]|nr:isochorismate synthase [Glaciihabitans sp.]
MIDNAGQMPALHVETQALDNIRPLVPLVDPRNPLVFIRRGQGIAGVGEALRLEFSGPDRMREAAAAWKRVVEAATVIDPLGIPGSGLVAFGAFTFADDSTSTSVLIVPSIVIGRREGTSWITRINCDAPLPKSTPMGPEYRLRLRPGTLSAEGYKAAVDVAVDRIRNNDLSKVVLARDLVGHLPEGADLRRVTAELALGYPDCWTFAVDGLIGSSPETLVSASRGTVSARVLAGSRARGADALEDQEAAVALATSTKDQDEHQYALQSLLTSLRPHSRNVTTSEVPFTLKLPNLWHLASDVEGTLTDGSTALDLIDSLHPTAAVAGHPTVDALDLITELEPFDRGR